MARIYIRARVFDEFGKRFWSCYGVGLVLCQAMDVIRGEGDEGKDDGVGREADEADHHLSPASQNPLTLLLSQSLFLIGHLTLPTRCQIHRVTRERNPILTLI